MSMGRLCDEYTINVHLGTRLAQLGYQIGSKLCVLAIVAR